MTTIEKIKAKIERLKSQLVRGACAAQIEMETNCKEEAYDEVLSFLSTLESEKPMDLDGLDEEVHSFFDECIEVYEVPLYGKVKEEVITADCYEITARHFAQWGAEHLKK